MDKLKNLFNNHWEKLFLGLVGLFSLYSIGGSLVGIMSSDNDRALINKTSDEIKSIIQNGSSEEFETYGEYISAFKTKINGLSMLSPYADKLPLRMFSEEAKVDIYGKVKDIVQGHTNSSSKPGPSCEAFFCKIKGENICLVCGARGEREYEFKKPKLTLLNTIRSEIKNQIKENPYVDRKKVSIVWEDDINSDRTIFKERLANVFRIAVNEDLLATMSEHLGKPTYQKAFKDYVTEKGIKPYMKGGQVLLLKADHIGGSAYQKPSLEKKNEEKEENGGLIDLFSTNEKPSGANNQEVAKPTNKANLHPLHDEKIFFNFVDEDFEPLTKYWYVLFETAKGVSAAGKEVLAFKFAEPVEVITGAETLVYLTRVSAVKDENNQEVKDASGNLQYKGDFTVYQYLDLQDIFYDVRLQNLTPGDEIGKLVRDFRTGEAKELPKTKIKSSKTAYMRGSDLNDDEWTIWRERFTEDMKARNSMVQVNLPYHTGLKLISLGIEKRKVMVEVGPRILKGHDELGNPIYEREKEEKEVESYFALVKNVITGQTEKIYEMKNNEISESLEQQKIKTTADLKEK